MGRSFGAGGRGMIDPNNILGQGGGPIEGGGMNSSITNNNSKNKPTQQQQQQQHQQQQQQQQQQQHESVVGNTNNTNNNVSATGGDWSGRPGARCSICGRRSEAVGGRRGFDYFVDMCGGCADL